MMKRIRITVFVSLMFLTTSFFGAVNVQGYHDWDAGATLSTTASTFPLPEVAVSDQYVHVVWSENTPQGNSIYYARNPFDGEPVSWESPINLALYLPPWWPPATYNMWAPAIATWDNYVYVVWMDNTITSGNPPPGDFEIYFLFNNYYGDPNWWQSGSFTQVTTDGVESLYPTIAASYGDVHIAWQGGTTWGFDVFYSRIGINPPQTPTPPYRVSSNAQYISTELPTITAQLGFYTSQNPIIYVAYQQKLTQPPGSYWEIYYTYSTDNGQNWATEVQLSQGLTSDSMNPSIASYRPQASGGPPPTDYTVHVVWEDYYDGPNILYRRIGDDAITWIGGGIPLGTGQPKIAACGLSIGVVWRQKDPVQGDYDIYWRWSWDNGYNWVSSEIITQDTTASHMPAVAVDYRQDHDDENYNSISVVWVNYPGSVIEIKYQRKPTDESVVPFTFVGARTRTSAVWTGSEAYIFGGRNGPSSYLDEIVQFIPPSTSNVMTTHLTHFMSDTSAIWYDGSAYIFGGACNSGPKCDNGAMNTIIRYEPPNTIKDLNEVLPAFMYGTSAVFDGTYAYIIGGYGHEPFSTQYQYYDTVWRYDPFSGFVTYLTSLPPPLGQPPDAGPRAFTSAVYIPPLNSIYIIGGKNKYGDVNEILKLKLDDLQNPDHITFDIILPGSLGGPRYGTSAVWDPNPLSARYIYIFGGLSMGSDYTSDLIIRYDIASVAPDYKYMSLSLPTFKGYTSAVGVWDGLNFNAYVFGGYYYAPAGDQIVQYHPPTH